MSTILDELRQALGDAQVLDPGAAAGRRSSFWDASPMKVRALVKARGTADVGAALRICHAHGQPVVTHGGLTGCVEGATTTAGDVVISLERLTAIEDIDPVGRTATVGAGVVLQKLQETVAAHGLYFPLDLGARGSCTVGGNVATNAGGINVLRYGMMRNQVLGLEAVLADGTVISSLNRMLKNNAGYDLKHLFIGSEGTLGIVTKVIVRLEEKPTSRNSAMVAMETFEEVCGLLKYLQRRLGGQLSSYEVMWGDYFRAVTEPGFHRPPMDRSHGYYVMLEAEGADPGMDETRFIEAMEEAMEQNLVATAVIPQSETERRSLWNIRENFEAIQVEKPSFLYDVSLPMRDMEAYVAAVKARLKRRWPDGTCHVIGHIGDGNLHLFVHPDRAGEHLHEESDEDVYAPLAPIGGSISAEHGIGCEKRMHLSISRSPDEIGLMHLLKRSLDPKGILNAGKVL